MTAMATKSIVNEEARDVQPSGAVAPSETLPPVAASVFNMSDCTTTPELPLSSPLIAWSASTVTTNTTAAAKATAAASGPISTARKDHKHPPQPLLTPLSAPCCLRLSSTHALPSSCIHSPTSTPTASLTHDTLSLKLEHNASASTPALLASPISPVPPQAYLDYLARYSPVTAASPLCDTHFQDHSSRSPAGRHSVTSPAAASFLPSAPRTRNAIVPDRGAASTPSMDDAAATAGSMAPRRCRPPLVPLRTTSCATPPGTASGGGGARSAPLPRASATASSGSRAMEAGTSVGVHGDDSWTRAGQRPMEEWQGVQESVQGRTVAVPAVTAAMTGGGKGTVAEATKKGKRKRGDGVESVEA